MPCCGQGKCSLDEKILRQATLDVCAHESHFEFKEGYLATVVSVKPIEHLLKEQFFLVLSEGLSEGADERFTHWLALVEVEPAVAIAISVLEGLLDETCELFLIVLLSLLLLLGRLVNKVIEHECLLEVDTDDLRWRCLHDELDSFAEASANLDVDLHAEGLGGLGGHLEAPDHDLRLVTCRAHQELAIVTRLVPNDHS